MRGLRMGLGYLHIPVNPTVFRCESDQRSGESDKEVCGHKVVL